MDERYVLNAVEFSWDADKAVSNLRKHNVSFLQAAEAFFDPFVRVIDASADEDARDALVGMDSNWNLLFVVHLEVLDDGYRIVSARRATAHERQVYES